MTISFSQEYNIEKSTEDKILQHQVMKLVNKNSDRKQKVISSAENKHLEDAIYLEFLQQLCY